MNHQNTTAPAEAYAPDPDQVGTGVPASLPQWFVQFLSLLLLLFREHVLAACHRPTRRLLPAWCYERPDLPPASTQALAASIRGPFGRAIRWMCLRRGIGPGHPNWPELSRAIVAFGGSLNGFRPGLPAFGLQWWENPDIVPGMIGLPAPTQAADALAARLARQAVADAPSPPRPIVPVGASHTASPAPAPRRRFCAPAATGPPAGLPGFPHNHIRYA